MQQEIQSLLQKQVICQILAPTEGFYSNEHVHSTKERGGSETCHQLDKFMKSEHFKVEGLHTVKASNWMAKVDLKDAFFMVPIAPQVRHLLFKFWEKTFQFNCLPFGLCTAPKVSAKILKLLVEMLRSLGIQLVIYILLLLDDTAAVAYINRRGGQHHQSCLS